jgi:NMD protein affecting ribosome stability and mRNA decay
MTANTKAPIINCARCGCHVRADEATIKGVCPTCIEWEARLVPIIEAHDIFEQQEEREAA